VDRTTTASVSSDQGRSKRRAESGVRSEYDVKHLRGLHLRSDTFRKESAPNHMRVDAADTGVDFTNGRPRAFPLDFFGGIRQNEIY